MTDLDQQKSSIEDHIKAMRATNEREQLSDARRIAVPKNSVLKITIPALLISTLIWSIMAGIGWLNGAKVEPDWILGKIFFTTFALHWGGIYIWRIFYIPDDMNPDELLKESEEDRENYWTMASILLVIHGIIVVGGCYIIYLKIRN